MSDNPYEAPKTIQPLAPKKIELFDRLGGYLRWSFRLGLLLVIVSAFVNTRSNGLWAAVGILGAIIFIASLVGVILLSIWGFIKGFREGRLNQA